jgi:N-acetyl-gamma-glutamyl-phosphate reductase
MAKTTKNTIQCVILGASGYAGMELARLLAAHPRAELAALSSDTYSGARVRDVFPAAPVADDVAFVSHNKGAATAADLYFVAFPHGKAHPFVKKLAARGRVIDISADFRLRNPADYEKWYHFKHPYPALVQSAVYGLPEVYKRDIRNAQIVANPGCYPTSVLLGLLPLKAFQDRLSRDIIVDAKSGYSGAGRSAKTNLLLSEGYGDFMAYKIVRHNHISEMQQEAAITLGGDVRVAFTPHLIPAPRGILSTLYVRMTGPVSEKQLRAAYESECAKHPFLRLADPGAVPSIKQVNGTNLCLVNAFVDVDNGLIKIVSAIDNLIKGAAGQAVQNMNIMFGAKETMGLASVPIVP